MICQPLREWLWLVGCIAAAVAIPVAVLSAWLTILFCAKQNGCAMRVKKEKAQTTQDLRKSYEALLKAHGDRIAEIRAEADATLNETGEHPAIPEKKP